MKHVLEKIGLIYPIIQGGMGNISNAPLAAAVSNAGGLGTVGCGTMTPEEVEAIILETRRKTEKPFAINIPITVTPYLNEMIHLVIKHQIPVVSLSAGNPAPFISMFHEHEIHVIAVIASVKHAKKAEEAGADLLVAEGYEAAGINSSLELTTFTLIPQIVQQVKVPVFAAGGIGDGKGLAAALMLGASGVQIGTRLIATKESPVHDAYKKGLIEAADTDTVIVGRSIGKVRRVLKNSYAHKLVKNEQHGITSEQYQNLTSEAQHVVGAMKGDFENGFVNSGQIAGLISSTPTVQQLFDEMMDEAKQQMMKRLQELGSFSF
ncbi:NAD(P)H-dependent flavin oxidoreductase [Priestia koreensis]|uniref:NAD(P)H-dependent flavin oxidoreductase n=1 Tax=Priestia koreensis TaxID=284581 RepID=UPI00205260C7|nr:DUF561 domain-containing protein [Priestia koreensis]UNL85688.1 DUF561 domain-containing protein [Priestia koreensis]